MPHSSKKMLSFFLTTNAIYVVDIVITQMKEIQIKNRLSHLELLKLQLTGTLRIISAGIFVFMDLANLHKSLKK